MKLSLSAFYKTFCPSYIKIPLRKIKGFFITPPLSVKWRKVSRLISTKERQRRRRR